MGWFCGYILSVVSLIAFTAWAIVVYVRKYSPGRVLTPFRLFCVGMFLSVMFCLIPLYCIDLADTARSWLSSVIFSFHHALQIFTLDADRDVILKSLKCPEAWLAVFYSVYLSISFVVAPLLTAGFLLSFFKNASAYLRYLWFFSRDVYVFSELNEKSLALGRDLRKNHKRARVVYADVFEDRDEESYELVEQAAEFRAICFKNDILSINLGWHCGRAKIVLFVIGNDSSENDGQTLKLVSRYNQRKNTELYVFSSSIESELLLAQADKGRMKVRRVNEARSLVNRILYENGHELFENARPRPDGSKKISAVIVGLGSHGTAMLKALSWYCQMDGYHVEIDAFDADEKAEDRFRAQAPELMSEKYNGVVIPGEAEYTIRIHSGCDVETESFANEIYKLKDATFAFVSLGSDELNVRTAVNLRMLFERMKIRPVIQAVVYGSDEKAALTGVKNYRGQEYGIDFIGDIESSYSEAVIINSQLEDYARKIHMKWGKEEEFWQYEYNYNSSIASAMHLRARVERGIPGAGKKEEELTDAERAAIEALEHRRWNAYMRSEGYVYSGSTEKSSRNDLAKMHHDLVDYSSLTEEEKRKDSRVGTA